MSDNVGQPVVIENRPGSSGYIALERLTNAAADGYTLLMMSSNDAALPSLRSKLAVDITRDLSPVSLVTAGPMMLVVRPTLAAKNVKELIALAQSQPGKLQYGTSGAGGTVHLTSELFNSMAKADIRHVPFKGSADSILAVASGEIDMSFPSVTAAQPLVEAGRLRGLAVTGAKRMPSVPSLPTLDESGAPGVETGISHGVLTLSAVPKPIVATLNRAINTAISDAEYKTTMTELGATLIGGPPEVFTKFLAAERLKFADLIKKQGIKVN